MLIEAACRHRGSLADFRNYTNEKLKNNNGMIKKKFKKMTRTTLNIIAELQKHLQPAHILSV